MTSWSIRKPEPSNIQGLCVTCQEKPQRKKRNKYASQCSKCYKKRWPYKPPTWRANDLRKDHCELCNFIALHKCQLDLDHIDGNHNNDNSDNLQTLCANCHRLKTWLNKDWQ